MNLCLELIILPYDVARTVSIGEWEITTAYEAITSFLGVFHTRCDLVTT